jgi:hypothetical protein
MSCMILHHVRNKFVNKKHILCIEVVPWLGELSMDLERHMKTCIEVPYTA